MSLTQFTDDNQNAIPRVFRTGATVVIDGTSATTQSAVLTARIVRLACTGDVNYEIGANPVATADTVLLPADSIEIVKLDGSDKIAVLGGKLWITILE